MPKIQLQFTKNYENWLDETFSRRYHESLSKVCLILMK